jgi:uncharacterized membrane protein YfcA
MPPDSIAWWVWPSVLFVATFAFGLVAVVGGLGGGTIFVPIVAGFFPFHLDFVRAAGLLVALSGALAAGPHLLRMNLADLRLALPIALVTSASAIVGARVGLGLPTAPLQISLGLIVFGLLALLILARRADVAESAPGDALSRWLGLEGMYYEATLRRLVEWRVRRTWWGLVLFVFIGVIAGMFGIGAGWANVAVLNLVMGVPLKVAAGTSVLLLSVTDTTAAWVYLHQGAILPLIVVPSVLGIMLGARVGVRLLDMAKPRTVRAVLIAVLFLSGVRSLLKGLEVWP